MSKHNLLMNAANFNWISVTICSYLNPNMVWYFWWGFSNVILERWSGRNWIQKFQETWKLWRWLFACMDTGACVCVYHLRENKFCLCPLLRISHPKWSNCGGDFSLGCVRLVIGFIGNCPTRWLMSDRVQFPKQLI